jgi:hypothetical protein
MYSLLLTSEDFDAINFAGARYSWSFALQSHCDEGENDIPEVEAWDIKQAIDEDTEGGHQMFPLLDPNSELAGKLIKFYELIV